MLVHLRRSVILAVVALILTFAYAFVGTGVAQVLFKHQADGSITANGSTLIGQNWSQTKCPATRSGAACSRAGPTTSAPTPVAKTNPAEHPGDDPLVANGQPRRIGCHQPRAAVGGPEAIHQELVAYWHSAGVNPTPDLVTTSGSGYDPDITAADALAQIPMVSKATGLAPSTLRALIARENNGAQLGFLGSSYIDVLQLNEALAKLR